MREHVYVIGSNSFSGSHFVRFALAKGWLVTGVSRSLPPDPVFLPYLDAQGNEPKNFTFLQCDLNHDLDRLMEHMEADRPSCVVNFAAQGMVAESWQNPGQWLNTNTLSQILFHDRLRKCEWLEKYVQISTPEVYGSTSGLVKENTHYAPSTPYAVSKAATDMSLMAFVNAYKFPAVFTRAANVFGAGQQLFRIVPRTVLRFLTGQSLELHGGGHSVRSFIHITDVADATWRAMLHGEPGSIFHVSTSRNISIRDLVFLIATMLNVDPDKHIKVVGDRLGKDAAYQLDSSRIREELGWSDHISLEQGIQEVITWASTNLEQLQRLPQDYIHKA